MRLGWIPAVEAFLRGGVSSSVGGSVVSGDEGHRSIRSDIPPRPSHGST